MRRRPQCAFLGLPSQRTMCGFSLACLAATAGQRRLTVGIRAGGAVAIGRDGRVRAVGAALAVLGALVAREGALGAAASGVEEVAERGGGLGGAALRADVQVACKGGGAGGVVVGQPRKQQDAGWQAMENALNTAARAGRMQADASPFCAPGQPCFLSPHPPGKSPPAHHRRRRSFRPGRGGTRHPPGRSPSGSSGRCPAQQGEQQGGLSQHGTAGAAAARAGTTARGPPHLQPGDTPLPADPAGAAGSPTCPSHSAQPSEGQVTHWPSTA